MKECVTHHSACHCREAKFAKMETGLLELLQIQGDIIPGRNDEFIRARWVREIAEKALADPV